MSFPGAFGIVLILFLIGVIIKLSITKEKKLSNTNIAGDEVQEVATILTDETEESYEKNKPVGSESKKQQSQYAVEKSGKVDWINMRIWYEKMAKKQGSGLLLQTIMCFLAVVASPLITQRAIDNQRLEKQIADKEWNQYRYQFDDQTQLFEDSYKRFMESQSEKKERTPLPYLVIISVLSILQVIVFLSAGIKDRLKNVSFTKLDRNLFKGVWVTVDELVSAMNLQKEDISIYYLHSNSFEAHVLKKANNVSIYLTRNIISFYSQDKEKFKAILAHELGHVLQNDTRFLLVGVNTLIIPAILVAIGGVSLMITGTSLGLFSAFGGIVILTFAKFFSKRRESEYLADTASLCFLQNENILNVIHTASNETNGLFYPTKTDRINYLNNVIKKFSIN